MHVDDGRDPQKRDGGGFVSRRVDRDFFAVEPPSPTGSSKMPVWVIPVRRRSVDEVPHLPGSSAVVDARRMHAARVSLALALLSTACAESDGAWYSARASGSWGGVEVLRVDVENDTCITIHIGEMTDPDLYKNVKHKPSSQSLGLVMWGSGAEDCTFGGFGTPITDVGGKVQADDIRMTEGPFSIACRVGFDLTIASDSEGEVHAKAVNLPVESPSLCGTPYREPVDLRDLSAEAISADSFAVFAWEPSFEVCARASFGWFSADYVDVNDAETPMGWTVHIDVFRVEEADCNGAGTASGIYVPTLDGVWGSANFDGAGQTPCSLDIDLTANMALSYYWVPPRVHFKAKGLGVDGC